VEAEKLIIEAESQIEPGKGVGGVGERVLNRTWGAVR
jgi:hypothetical protein